jgi:ribosomal subunit interface protein
MKIIIKGKNFKISPNIQTYVEEKIRKYQEIIEEPSICEISLIDTGGPKGGKDKVVHISCSMPGLKKAIFVKERTSDMMGSIDLAQERFESQIIKYKERKKIGSRFPAKYWASKMLETGAVGPRWFWRKLKRGK